MLSFRNAWRRFTSTRYTRLLEQEVARLRAENRALLNSILGIAGIPPITLEQPQSTESNSSAVRISSPAVGDQSSINLAANVSQPPVRVPVPLRRRSWHQINRTLEIDSARKKDRSSSDLVSLPVATRTQSR